MEFGSTGTMANGINDDDEVRDMLLVLELTRRRLNEDTGAGYELMLGVVDRNEVHQDWLASPRILIEVR